MSYFLKKISQIPAHKRFIELTYLTSISFSSVFKKNLPTLLKEFCWNIPTSGLVLKDRKLLTLVLDSLKVALNEERNDSELIIDHLQVLQVYIEVFFSIFPRDWFVPKWDSKGFLNLNVKNLSHNCCSLVILGIFKAQSTD
jgi:hypothetical protein